MDGNPIHWDLECDVLLVGSGAGSLAASATLVRHRLQPLIIEKSARVGGASAYSGGIVWVPNNHRMRAKGLSDSREEALAYLETVSCGRGDRQIAEAYVDAAPRIIEGLQNSTSLRWVTYPDLPDYYAEVPGGKTSGRFLLPHPSLVTDALEASSRRWSEMSLIRPSVHVGDRQRDWVWGRALVGCLWARVLEDGVPFLLNHRATSLIREGEQVVGVAVSAPGRNLNIRARSGVVLNTGGFEWNEELTRQCVQGPYLHPQTPPANEGDGHIMAAQIGAGLALMDQTIGMTSVCVAGETNDGKPLYRILFQELARPHSMLVNLRGRRFANETYFVDIARAWAAVADDCSSSNLPCFFIFDDRYRRKYGFPEALSRPGALCKSDSLEGLARAMGIDPKGLLAEVRDYNASIETEGRDRFGRGQTAYQRAFGDQVRPDNPTLGALDEAPFYGVQIHPATSSHRGGMTIDRNGRVLDVRREVIARLFACGNCAAGVLTGATYFTGTAIGHSIVFGTLAAEAIISDLGTDGAVRG